MIKIRSFFLIFIFAATVLQSRGQAICAGNSYTLNCNNPLLLSNPVYSINPGGITNTTNIFVLSPTVTTTYTLYTTGQNSLNTTVTTSAITVFTVFPQPSLAPTLTMATCLNTLSALDLNLTFNPPNNPLPSYFVSWNPLPSTVLNPQQTYATGPFTPTSYSLIVTSLGNCTDTAHFIIPPEELNPNVSAIIPSQTITCGTNPLIFEGQSTSTNVLFNWSIPGSTTSINSSSIIVTANLAAPGQTALGTFTLSVTGILSLCTSQSLITVYQNVFAPTPVISSGGSNTITCSNPTITLTNQSTSNIPPSTGFPTSQPIIGYRWFGPPPQGPATISNTYGAYTAGIYTMVAIDYNNACLADTTITIFDACNLVNVSKNNLSVRVFTLFPNPCNTKLQLDLELPNEPTLNTYDFAVYSSVGQLVLNKTLFLEHGEITISVENLNNGIYFGHLKCDSGQSYTCQFIVFKN